MNPGTILAIGVLQMPTVMAMEANLETTYRLERWIAVFLALLFFVPFMANAQESQLALVCSGNTAFLQRTSSAPANAFVIDDPRLVAGPVEQALCSDIPVPTPVKVFGSTLDYRCGDADDEGIIECTLELDGQPLAKRVAFETEQLMVRVSFAGDLDRDGRLDLLVDVARNRFDYRPALFLSSPAPAGDAVLRVAELSHSSRNRP
jgi:hypothetical protein